MDKRRRLVPHLKHFPWTQIRNMSSVRDPLDLAHSDATLIDGSEMRKAVLKIRPPACKSYRVKVELTRNDMVCINC